MAPKTATASKKSSKKASKKPSKKPSKKTSKIGSQTGLFDGGDSSKFSLIFINLSDECLMPIITVLYKQIINHKRLAIVGFDKKNIFDSILTVTDDPYFIEAQRCIIEANCDVSIAIQIQIIQKRIYDFIKENERFLESRKEMKSFDLLDFWEKNAPPVNVVKTKGGKEKTVKTPVTGKPSKTGKSPKSDAKSAATIPFVLNQQVYTKIPKRGQALNKEIFIEDNPEEGKILFIILIGIYSVNLIEELKKIQLPILSIINFTPIFNSDNNIPKVMSSDIEVYQKFWMEIKEFRVKDISNQIGFIDIHVPVLSNYEVERNSTEIYRQISWLIYDIEDKSRQHNNYLNHMKMFNVNELNKIQPTEYYEKYIDILSTIPLGNQSVEIIFNAILEQVDFITPNNNNNVESYVEPIDTHPPSEEEEPLLTSDICLCSTPTIIILESKLLFFLLEKLIIDYSDKMLQNCVSVENNLNTFDTEERITEKAYNLEKIWLKYQKQSDEQLEKNWIFIRKLLIRFCNEIKLSEFIFSLQLLYFMRYACKKDCGCEIPEISGICLCFLLTDTNEGKNIKEYCYLEPFTVNSFKQIIHNCEIEYNFKTEQYFPYSDVILLKFWNNKNKIFIKNYTNVIPTKLCFRDYINYVDNKIENWREKQEILYEEYLINKKQQIELANNPDILELYVITNNDFILNNSFKKLKLDKELAEELAFENENFEFFDDSPKKKTLGGKKSTKSIKSTKSLKSAKSVKSAKSIKSAKSAKSVKSVKSSKPTKSGKKIILEPIVKDYELTFSSLIKESDKCFNGYDIDERRFQIDTIETIFRSYILYIKVVLDKFLYLKKYFSIQIKQNRTILYLNQIINGNKKLKLKTLNVQCFNGIRILVDVEIFTISYSLQNGLKITSLPDKIEQKWLTKSNDLSSELRRCFYKNGCIVIYYGNQNVKVLTSTGMIYETKVSTGLDSTRRGSLQSNAGFHFQSGDSLSQLEMMYRDHIEFLEFLSNENININEFKLILPDGNQYLIKNKRIISILKKIMVRESFDYSNGEILIRRQDGVKLIYSVKKLMCLYNDGTLITTTTIDNQFIEDFHFDEVSTQSLNASGVFNIDSGSSTQFIYPLINKITKFVTSEHFIHITRNFQFQHTKYAFLTFKNDSNEILFDTPGNITINLKKNSIYMSLEDDVSLLCNEEAVIFKALHCKKDQRFATTKINLKDENEFLTADDGYKNIFSINTAGECSLNETEGIDPELINCTKCNFNQFYDERLFILKRNMEGYELLKEKEVNTWKKSRDFSIINEEPNGNLITMHPHISLNKRQVLNFEIPDGFVDTLCNRKCNCTKDIINAKDALTLLPNELLMRCFLATSNRCRDFASAMQRFFYYKSTNEDVLPEEDKFSSIILKKENYVDILDTVEILKDAGIRTINYYISMWRKKLKKIESNKIPKPPSEQFLAYLAQLKEKRIRMAIYHKMLRENIIPKYYDFYESGSHIKLMDLSQYETVKKDSVPEVLQIKTPSCRCICKCVCNKKVDSDSCSIGTYCPCDVDEISLENEMSAIVSSKHSSMITKKQ